MNKRTYQPVHNKQFHLFSDHKNQDALACIEQVVTWIYSFFNGHVERTYLTATLSQLDSSHAKGSHIALHKKPYLYWLLRTRGSKCVKVLRRLKGKKDFTFFLSQKCLTRLSSITSTHFKKRETPTLLGRTWKSHQLLHGSSQHWKHLWICVASRYPNIVSHRANAPLRASLAHPDGAAQTLTAAKHRAIRQQETPPLLEMWAARDTAVNP